MFGWTFVSHSAWDWVDQNDEPEGDTTSLITVVLCHFSPGAHGQHEQHTAHSTEYTDKSLQRMLRDVPHQSPTDRVPRPCWGDPMEVLAATPREGDAGRIGHDRLCGSFVYMPWHV